MSLQKTIDLTNQISELLTPYANEMEDERLGVFLTLTVGRVLLKNNNIKDIDKNKLRHITDWLKASIINNAAWLSNLDADQRPKKLMKFSSIEKIMQEADKVMLIEAQKLSGIKLVEGDEELVTELKDGFYIVKLLTPEALDRESATMQHCIGQGGYDHNLNDPRFSYLSLRDPAGKAHVTLEIETNEIIQLQGKQNEPPIQKYMDILIPYLKEKEYKCELSASEILHIIDKNSNWYRVNEIPENTVFSNMTIFHYTNIESLPSGLVFEQDVSLGYTGVTKIPERLTVQGSLTIDSTSITKLPSDLSVKENLYMNSCDIEHLTAIKNPIKCLYADYSNVITISDDFIVTEKMSLRDTKKLKKLPDNLHLNYLGLVRSSIKTLPKGMHVKYLEVIETAIENIPDDIQGLETLVINNGVIKKLPDHIKEYETLIAYKSQIKELPDNLTVTETLKITASQEIKVLPRGLDVNDLEIDETNITELPDDIKIRGYLDISNSIITKLPSHILSYDSIIATYSKLVELPDNLKVDSLDISYSKEIKSLPKGLVVESLLDMSNTLIKELPEDLKVKTIDISGCSIDHIPDSLLDEDIEILVYGTSMTISEYAESLRVDNNMVSK